MDTTLTTRSALWARDGAGVLPGTRGEIGRLVDWDAEEAPSEVPAFALPPEPVMYDEDDEDELDDEDVFGDDEGLEEGEEFDEEDEDFLEDEEEGEGSPEELDDEDAEDDDDEDF